MKNIGWGLVAASSLLLCHDLFLFGRLLLWAASFNLSHRPLGDPLFGEGRLSHSLVPQALGNDDIVNLGTFGRFQGLKRYKKRGNVGRLERLNGGGMDREYPTFASCSSV